MDIVVVIVIVAGAVIWLGWLLTRSLRCKDTGCNCTGNCPIAKFCDKNFMKPPSEKNVNR